MLQGKEGRTSIFAQLVKRFCSSWLDEEKEMQDAVIPTSTKSKSTGSNKFTQGRVFSRG